MAKLEHFGLIDSPHRSAGRVPTDAGYRFFIDRLLKVNDLAQSAQNKILAEFGGNKTSNNLIQSASSILSNITHLTGIVSLTHSTPAEIRHIEFMRLSEKRILVILVINEDDVHNKVIQVERDYSDTELQQAATTLNQYLLGQSFETARNRLKVELLNLKSDVNTMMEAILKGMEEVCADSNGDELLTTGQSNLLQYSELNDINNLRGLFDVFNEKTDLLKLLDSCTSASGVEIFIGSESGHSVLSNCSVVGAPYHKGGEIIGVLGVIGPTRIAYEQVIPMVDVTAKLLSLALNTQK